MGVPGVLDFATSWDAAETDLRIPPWFVSYTATRNVHTSDKHVSAARFQ